MSKNRKDYFIKIVFESFETVQTTADKANNYAWGEIGAQVLSNAVVGVITGRELKDGDDWDWLTIITTPVGYYHVDILNPSFTPEESLKYGAGWASINFIVGTPWFPEIVRKWGAEISDIEDIGWAAAILAIGYISDKGESCLNASAENTVKNGRKSHINISGKTVIATSIK